MRQIRLRTLTLIVVPALLLAAACDSAGVSPSSSDASPPTASASIQATSAPQATPTPRAAPITKAHASNAPPQDPYAAAKAAGASAVCADGSWSFSQNRSGTCSHHGGVHWWTGNLGPAGPGAH